MGYLDPHHFASLSPARHNGWSGTSTRASQDNNDSAMSINDDFNTAIPADWMSEGLNGFRQVSIASMDFIKFSSTSSRSSQSPNSFYSRDDPTRLVNGENYFIPIEESGYDASFDTDSLASQASYASAIYGSMSDATLLSTDQVPIQTLRMQTSNAAAEHLQHRRSAEQLRLALLAVLRESSTNVQNHTAQMCIPQETEDTPQPPITKACRLCSSTFESHDSSNRDKKDAIVTTSLHERNIASASPSAHQSITSQDHKADKLAGQVGSSNELSKSHYCCIGVLSAFEEEHLCYEDKQAILEGGCHGLCGLQLTTNVNTEGHDKLDEDSESCKSSPCVKGPFEKAARFISAMPSAVMPDGRRGPTSTQPRFSRRRCAARYQQPRQPLPLVQHPPRNTMSRPGSPLLRSSARNTSTMLNSHSTKSMVMASDFLRKRLDLPQSKFKADYSTGKDKFEQDTRKDIPDTVRKHRNQRKSQKKGELSDAVDKEKKTQGKMYSRFSSLFRKHEFF